MNLQKYLLLLILSVSLFCKAQISDKIQINKSDIQSYKENEFDKIKSKTDYFTREVGSPELPIYRVSYVLPVDVQVTGVTFATQTKQKHEQNFNIIPVQQPVTTDNSNVPAFTQPNKKVYQSTSPYPNKIYEIESDRFLQGYHIVTLLIYPFEYIPKSKMLNYYS